MNDYFKDLSDWEDADDRWRPTTYLEIEDTVTLGGVEYTYYYAEHDWWVMGQTREENLALGHCHEIRLEDGSLPMKSGGVFMASVYGVSFKEAMTRMKAWYKVYIHLKDMSQEEIQQYRQE